MSRKRAKDKRPEEAVPDEILAEGSGPNEVVDANPQSLVAAAQGLVDKRKERKGKGKKGREATMVEPADSDAAAAEPADSDAEVAEPADVDAANGESADPDAAVAADSASAEPIEVVAAPAIADGEAPRKRRGKKGKRGAAVDDSLAAAPAIDDTASEAHQLAESDIALAILEADATHPDDEPAVEDELDDSAFDASADNVSPESLADQEDEVLATAEGEAIALVEDAVMRAEAEAELGDAELGDADDLEAPDDGELGAALPTTAASMGPAQLKNLVEALVFAADKPVTLVRLRQLTRVSDVKRLEQALAEIASDYQSRGVALTQVSGGYQFRTNTQFSVWVQQLIAGRPVRLSRAQLETLAIVAYRQPITRPEIDEIRGVDSSATLRLLLDRALIRTLGKKEDVGRPMLYGTTKEFLDFFSLGDLRELPTLREYSELTAESRKVMTDRLGADPSEAGEGEDGEDGDIAAAAGSASEAPIGEDPAEVFDAESTESMDASADSADADALAAIAAVDSSARLVADAADGEDVASDVAGEDIAGDVDVTDDADDASMRAMAPGHVIRDGVEYDRWGQPLGPTEDEAVAAAGDSSGDESLEAAGDSSSDESVESGSNDATVEAASDSSSDESVEASSGDVSVEVAGESSMATTSDETLESSSDESVEAAGDSSSDESVEAAGDSSSDESVEAAGDSSNDVSVDASDEASSEVSASDEMVDAAGESSSDEAVDAAGESSSDESVDAAGESSSDESVDAAGESSNDESVDAAGESSSDVIDASSDESASEASSSDEGDESVAASTDAASTDAASTDAAADERREAIEAMLAVDSGDGELGAVAGSSIEERLNLVGTARDVGSDESAAGEDRDEEQGLASEALDASDEDGPSSDKSSGD